jgi:hypothetical protein
MESKFLTLAEQTINRYTNGGVQKNDVVKLVSNYKTTPVYKDLSPEVQKHIEDYFQDGKQYRAIDVKPLLPSNDVGVSDNRGTTFNVEVAVEIAPGRYDAQNKVTIPAQLLEVDETYPNLPNIPDDAKYDNKVSMTPKEPEENEEEQQTMTQQGDKLKKSETKLPIKNTDISKTSAPDKNIVGESYVAGFMKGY